MAPIRLDDSERAHHLDDARTGRARPFPVYDELSYPDFLNKHVIPNTPFLLLAKATAKWPAAAWRLPGASDSADGVSRPNFEALHVYEDQVVPVADTAAREFSEFERTDRPLGEVLDLWERGEGSSLYVKDWHLIAELCERGGAAKDVYEPPACFLDDWLSPPFHLSSAGEMPPSLADFRFVYLGPKGTFTPLHRDVYGSYSWSANVVGRKMWWFFPPGTEAKLRERNGLMFDVRGTDREALGIKIIQEEGEVIFVPSGWHHQVANLDFCISINHNFFSSPTLPQIYAEMTLANERVKELIEDIQDDIRTRLGLAKLPDGTLEWEAEWAAEVEGFLARDAGWGWEGFWACILDNMKRPPAPVELSPSEDERNSYVREVLSHFKTTSEYALLPKARATVNETEALLNLSQETIQHA